MTKYVDVPIAGRSYQVAIGAKLPAKELLSGLDLGNDIILVYDRVFDKLDDGACLRYWQDCLSASAKVRSFGVDSGEGSKSLSTYAGLCEEILAARITRQTTLVALGGGVLGDLAGFLAASLLRGLRFVQIPTTLLSQVDSSVGGKVGINAKAGKNLIGAFHQPQLVVAELDMLAYLPQREFSAGMAEVLKAALLADKNFWQWLIDHADDINQRDNQTLEQMIAWSVKIKSDVVLADETERTGRRALLNLGHTFAHALESKAGYDASKLIHGEAVSIGMVMAARLSPNIDNAMTGEIADLLQKFGLPIKTSLKTNPEELYDLMMFDKKVDQSGLKMIRLAEVGRAEVISAPDRAHILAAIAPSLEV